MTSLGIAALVIAGPDLGAARGFGGDSEAFTAGALAAEGSEGSTAAEGSEGRASGTAAASTVAATQASAAAGSAASTTQARSPITPPPSCSTVDFGSGKTFDCGGAFYSQVPTGWRVIPPPVGAKVTNLPNGAVTQTIKGEMYFTFGGGWYKPVYEGAGVVYDVVAKPS